MKIIGVEMRYRSGSFRREVAMLATDLVLPDDGGPCGQHDLEITVHTSEGDLETVMLRLPTNHDDPRGVSRRLTEFFDRQRVTAPTTIAAPVTR